MHKPHDRLFYTLPSSSRQGEGGDGGDGSSLSSSSSSSSSKSDLLTYIRNNVIGKDKVFSGPFGLRKVVYLDYTASGRSVEFIEDYIRKEVLPEYGNTHTTTSVTSLQTTLFRHEARDIIRNSCNASEHDSVIFVGSGSTAAINKLLHALNLSQPPVVFVGPYEHHSSFLPWLQAGAKVIRIRQTAEGLVDIQHLKLMLQEYKSGGRTMIGCFSAASNITGILVDVNAITVTLHQYGALALWDYATAAPYVQVDMNPVVPGENQSLVYKDAVFISTHKFIGGVQTPGILICKKKLFQNSYPEVCGGGSVFFVRREAQRFLQEPELKEEAGTPAIVESVRAGLVFQLKEAVTSQVMMDREHAILQRAVEVWRGCENLVMLGNLSVPRLPIFSFLVYHHGNGRFLHPNFVSAVLNDVFGVQSRSGCACAGPYAMDLLGLDEAKAAEFEELLAEDSRLDRTHLRRYREYSHREVLRPGFTRLNLPCFLTDQEVDFITQSVVMVAEHGWKLLPQYIFNPETGEWKQKNFQNFRDRKWLGHISYQNGKMEYKVPPLVVKGPLPSSYQKCLEEAKAIFEKASKTKVSLPDQRLMFDEKSTKNRWFLLPSEAYNHLHGNTSPPLPLADLPFCPSVLKQRLGLADNEEESTNHVTAEFWSRVGCFGGREREGFREGMVGCLDDGFSGGGTDEEGDERHTGVKMLGVEDEKKKKMEGGERNLSKKIVDDEDEERVKMEGNERNLGNKMVDEEEEDGEDVRRNPGNKMSGGDEEEKMKVLQQSDEDREDIYPGNKMVEDEEKKIKMNGLQESDEDKEIKQSNKSDITVTSSVNNSIGMTSTNSVVSSYNNSVTSSDMISHGTSVTSNGTNSDNRVTSSDSNDMTSNGTNTVTSTDNIVTSTDNSVTPNVKNDMASNDSNVIPTGTIIVTLSVNNSDIVTSNGNDDKESSDNDVSSSDNTVTPNVNDDMTSSNNDVSSSDNSVSSSNNDMTSSDNNSVTYKTRATEEVNAPVCPLLKKKSPLVTTPQTKWFHPPREIFTPTVKAMEEYEMVRDGDRVLVCLSGGKDSLSLLHTLRQFQFYSRSKGVRFELGAVTVDPQTPAYDPSPLKQYLASLRVPYFFESQGILETASNLPYQCASICSFCSRMKRGRIYSTARREGYNVLALGQHLDDLSESFLMSFFHNGSLRTMKACYTVKEGDLRVIRPFVYVREKLLRCFAEKSKLPVITENCPACFEAPKERHRSKQLLASQELLFPQLYNSMMAAMKPLMFINRTGENLKSLLNQQHEEDEEE